jgi:DNA-binding HxlR family transcriptional regulator
VYFGVPLNHTVVDNVAKSVVMKMSDDKGCNYHVGCVGGKWQFIIIYDQNCKTLSKGQLHREIL